jgi:hypothetical protein
MKKLLIVLGLILSISCYGQGTQYSSTKSGSITTDSTSTVISTLSLPSKELPIKITILEDKEFEKQANGERSGMDNSRVWCAFYLPENSNSMEIFFKKSQILLGTRDKVEMERRGKQIRHLLDILYPTTFEYKQRFGMSFDYTAVGDTNGNLSQKYEDNWGTEIVPLGQGFLFFKNGFYDDSYRGTRPQYKLRWERRRVQQSGVIMLELKKPNGEQAGPGMDAAGPGKPHETGGKK